MNQIATSDTKINPLNYLSSNPLLVDKIVTEFEYQSVKYKLYFQNRKLVYATHSVSPKERLERHLKKLSHRHSNLKGIWNKIGKDLDQFSETETEYPHTCPVEYRIITWLSEKKYIDSTQLKILGKSLTLEILESLLLINDLDLNGIKSSSHNLAYLWEDDLFVLVEIAKKNVMKWADLCPEIESPYQRPYLVFNTESEQERSSLSDENRVKLARVLRGFDFRQLGAILNHEELSIAKKLYPLIKSKTIILREPKSQFALLPKLNYETNQKENIPSLEKAKTKQRQLRKDLGYNDNSSYDNFFSLSEKSYKIACIDDSPIILKSLSAFLNRDNITVFPIANAAKAMMLLNSVKPDLIFMDIGMPLIDGYQLCSLLRKNNNFKDIPIIMLTGNTGFIDRAKAKIAGATDYMTKPFAQDDLLKIIFRYLSDN